MASSSPLTARTEFAAAINQICNERGIDPEVVLDTIKAAILAAYRKDYPEKFEAFDAAEEEENTPEPFTVNLDSETGSARIVDNESGADITPPGFGRIAAQTAKQVILQRVREAEKDAIISEYTERVGAIISGMVLRFDGKNVIVDIGRGQGIMPPEEQIHGEYYKMNQRLAVYIKEIRDTLRGKTIIVSRSAPELVEELFRREVPEVSSGAVQIKAVAREAGHRTKIAVFSTQEGVDPVGSCVGQKGVRVQEVINELSGEKIDIIQYSDDRINFIAASLAPAENLNIDINDTDQTATVTVPDDQLSLAIGKGGQNVRLAAKLTGLKIDIKGQSGKSVTSTSGDEEFEIDTLELATRTRNALVKAKITSLAKLKSFKDFQEIEGVGPKAAQEIEQALQKIEPAGEDKPEDKTPASSSDEPAKSTDPAVDTSTEVSETQDKPTV